MKSESASKEVIKVDPYNIGGQVLANDGTTIYPNVKVTCRNITRNVKDTFTSDPIDGSYAFNLSNPEFGGYAESDSIEIIARMGCFYKRETHTVDISAGAPTIDLTLALEDGIRILDLLRLNQELITFFRANLDDPNSRGTSRTETQSGTGSKVAFTLAENNVKFIRSITVADVLKKEWSDYYVDFQDKNTLNNPIVYFFTPPADGAKVEFTYIYGAQSWIYPDKPRIGISLGSYPRCQVNVFPINTRELNLGADSNISALEGEITVWSTKTNEVMDTVSKARELVMENKKTFHHFKLIIPSLTTRLIPTSMRGNRIVQQTQGFRIPLRVEKINLGG